MRAQPEHEEAAALTNLVFPFHGKFHHQLLGVGANEDEWRSRLLADLGTLKRERGNNEMCSPHRSQYVCQHSPCQQASGNSVVSVEPSGGGLALRFLKEVRDMFMSMSLLASYRKLAGIKEEYVGALTAPRFSGRGRHLPLVMEFLGGGRAHNSLAEPAKHLLDSTRPPFMRVSGSPTPYRPYNKRSVGKTQLGE
ncbi:Activating signal cointegrator 1 [Triplophysa tibetana]|uniref:Activating signal cointegrator 1 n=1 Tax=Triplophysa tibetana TaxID=1572043 RepID=A0A5A9PQ94_9TELE|nr:Activating signal cointegrator 1 [Triplophysa tibetana]